MNDFIVNAKLLEKQAKEFFIPLTDILRNCGQKVVIRFLKDKKIIVKTISEQRDLIQFINYNSKICDLFNIKTDCKTGIYDLSEFVNLFKIFDSELEFKYVESERKIELLSTVNGEDHSLHYYVCDETVVPKPPESIDFSKISWNASFSWVSCKHETLINAMKSLKYPNIIISGKQNDTFITFSITESDIKTTTFKSKVNIQSPISNSFNVIVDKAKFVNIISSSIHDYDINICERLLHFKGKSEIYDVEYMLSPLKK
jgi:hypothetical protein